MIMSFEKSEILADGVKSILNNNISAIAYYTFMQRDTKAPASISCRHDRGENSSNSTCFELNDLCGGAPLMPYLLFDFAICNIKRLHVFFAMINYRKRAARHMQALSDLKQLMT